MELVEAARFIGPAVPGGELQQAAGVALAEIAGDPDSLAELSLYGLDEGAVRSTQVRVEQKPGLDPASVIVAILVGTAGELTSEGVQTLWGMVLRRVRRQKGYDALGEPLDN